eukprot:s4563_g3.t1
MLRLCLSVAATLAVASSQDTCTDDGSGSCAAGSGSEDGVCFAVIAKEDHWKELEVRVAQILRHQHYKFASSYIDNAQKLVSNGLLDKWLVVDYSQKFIKRINKTANWDPFEHPPSAGFQESRCIKKQLAYADRHKTVSFTEFNEDYEDKDRPAHYFAIDQCSHGYLVVVEIEVIWMSYRKYSWVAAGLELMKDNPGLVLVQPAYPGIRKKYKELTNPKVEAEDITCRHPFSLPGWVSLGGREAQLLAPAHFQGQKYREYRCGGQLVKGKRCRDYEYLRGCGGMRLWQDALECVVCNRGSLRQAQLTDSDRVWVQKAPITCFRSDVGDMIEGINLVENGTVFPVSGVDFTLKLEEDEDSDVLAWQQAQLLAHFNLRLLLNGPEALTMADTEVCSQALRYAAFEEVLDPKAFVQSSWLFGPPRGELNPWAWNLFRANGSSHCRFPTKRQGRKIYDPCGPMPRSNLRRVLAFFTGYLNLTLDIDTLAFQVQSPFGQPLALRPTVEGEPCRGPWDMHDLLSHGGYQVRLVRAGRYLHQWLILNATCGNASATLEFRVWPSCIDVHVIPEDGALVPGFQEELGDETSMVASGSGYGTAAYCLHCQGTCLWKKIEAPSGSRACCPLGEGLCGSGPTAACSVPLNDWKAAGPVPRLTIRDIAAEGRFWPSLSEGNPFLGKRPIWGDGQAWRVELTSRNESIVQNDGYEVILTNPTAESMDFRVIFHIAAPKKITGVAVALHNGTTKRPSGLHLQISKNWHDNECFWERISYDGEWYSAAVQVRLPPRSRLKGELAVAYQFFGKLHTVSHAQLCLIGWPGSNGLWEEVGLGSEGESITFEPNLQQRRNLVLDTRPFLVCKMDEPKCTCQKEVNASGRFAQHLCNVDKVEGCVGDVNVTGWTENHGGSDFLTAIDPGGSYQYLTNVTVTHTSNGPRLTNATYYGVTADGAIRVERTVSTWATEDFPRYLHSFRYEVLRNVTYRRLAFYLLGGDWYNFVLNPSLAYGSRKLDRHLTNISLGLEQFEYSKDLRNLECHEPPCWFALLTQSNQEDRHAHRGLVVRRWRGQMAGQELPKDRGFVFSVFGSRNMGDPTPTLGLELGPGKKSLQAGDVISADLELLLFPKSEDVYYGPSRRLRRWLSMEPWEVVRHSALEAQLEVQVAEGVLQRSYPPRVAVSSEGRAEFRFLVPAEYPGVVPLTVAGVAQTGGCLCIWDNGCRELGEGGEFQTDYVPGEGFAQTFSLMPSEFGFELLFIFEQVCKQAG